MPIRFRCAYCNQLMAIATRKAGTVVRCPKCAGEIIVPMPEGAAGPEEGGEPAGGAAFDVEQLDFNAAAAPGGATAAAAGPQAPTEATPTPGPSPPPPPPPPGSPQRVGVFVPLGMLIISLGLIVLLLILMLVLGLIIGRASNLPPEGKSAAISFSRDAEGVREGRDAHASGMAAKRDLHARSSPAASRTPSAAPGLARNSCRA